MFVNKVLLLGIVVMKPEVRYTAKGKAVAKFALWTERAAETDGNRVSGIRHPVVAFGQLAETVKERMREGQTVFVEGCIGNGEIVAQDIRYALLLAKEEGDGKPSQACQEAAGERSASA